MAGRPTLYTPELADRVCQLIGERKTTREVCKILGISRTSLNEYLKNDEAFANRYARAQEEALDDMGDELIELADEATPENYNAKRLQVDTRKWVMSKRGPRKYGDKVALTDADGGKFVVNISLEPKPDAGS